MGQMTRSNEEKQPNHPAVASPQLAQSRPHRQVGDDVLRTLNPADLWSPDVGLVYRKL